MQLLVVFSLLQLISFFLNFYFWHPEERDIEVHSFQFLSSGISVTSYFQYTHVKTCGIAVPFCSPLIPPGSYRSIEYLGNTITQNGTCILVQKS